MSRVAERSATEAVKSDPRGRGQSQSASPLVCGSLVQIAQFTSGMTDADEPAKEFGMLRGPKGERRPADVIGKWSRRAKRVRAVWRLRYTLYNPQICCAVARLAVNHIARQCFARSRRPRKQAQTQKKTPEPALSLWGGGRPMSRKPTPLWPRSPFSPRTPARAPNDRRAAAFHNDERACSR
jgi:hypothetical protein